MENQIVKKEEEAKIIAKKRNQWANVGEVIHNKEIQLQLKAQASILKLIEPKSIEQIETAESALKIAKQEYNLLVTERKGVTDSLNGVINRLMNSEKDLASKFPAIEKDLISLKQQQAKNNLLIQQKADEILRLNTVCNEHKINSEAAFKQKILNQVSFAYEYALGKGNVEEKGLEDYLKLVKLKFKPEDFTIAPPVVNLIHASKIEFDLIWNKLCIDFQEPKIWIEQYVKDLDSKFEFYNVSLMNKKAAIENSKKLEATAAEELAKETVNKTVSATLSSIATNIASPVETSGKKLKTVYELDMVDNEENGLLIIAAFVGNFATTKQYIKVKNFFSLSVEQMSKTLVQIKNKDEKFSCTGIVFKQTDKL